MKKLSVLLTVICVVSILAAADVTLRNDKLYSGKISETLNGVVVLMDGSVLIRIPAEEILKVTDGGKDITASVLQEALSQTKQDSHFLTREDYFVAETDLGNKEWIRVGVAKMTKEASAATNGEAEFLSSQTGSTLWTKHFFRTRVAVKEDLQPGTMVICLDTAENGIYRAPRDGSEARSAVWWASRVTDNSEAYKGYVIVGGSYKVALDAIRLVIN